LEHAEQSLKVIHEHYHRFKQQGDGKGAAYARELVRLGQRRAQAAAHRAKSRFVRESKSEIAEWFKLWLSSPDVFETWLSLRKLSPEFQQKFPLSMT
jgi:hypothetical protein